MNKKIKNVKELSNGTKLYLLKEPMFVKDTLSFGSERYSMLWKQHGDYFELKDLGNDFTKEKGDVYEVVAFAGIDVTIEDYFNSIKDLLDVVKRVEGNKCINGYINIDNMHQTIRIKCLDETWEELFKTAQEEITNKNIPSKEYSHFYSDKYIRLIRE